MRLRLVLSLVAVLTIGLLPSAAAAAPDIAASTRTTARPQARPDSATGRANVAGVAHGRGKQQSAAAQRARPPRRLDQPPVSGRGSSAGKADAKVRGASGQVPTHSAEPILGAAETSGPSANTPVLGGSFTGMNEVGSIPPDPIMAAGPFQVVIATNDGYRAFDKNGTAVPNTVAQPCAGSCSLSQFFTNAVDGPFDPWLVYDEYIDRFWFLAVSLNDSPQRSDLLLALSNTSDVTDGWTLFRIDARTNGNAVQSQWCDYEKLGLDAQAVYLTCNMFSFPSATGSFQYAKIRVMTKDQFINNTCCLWADYWNLREGFLGVYASFTIQPAVMHGASAGDGEYLVNAFATCVFCPANELRVRHITNPQVCCVPGDQEVPNMDEETVTVGNFPQPPTAAQQGSSTEIDAGDNRLLYAFWKAGHLSSGQTIGCNDGDNACLAYTELDVSSFPSISTVSDFLFSEDGSDRYYPRVDANNAGNMSMVYTRSSSSEFAGSVYIGIPSSSTCTNCVDGPEAQLQAGGNSYVDFGCCPPGTRNRWGDYLGGASDPDGTGVWIFGQHVQTTMNTWSTRVGLTYEAQDLTPPTTTATLTPLANASGWNNTNVLVTLNATDAGVAGVRRITYSASGAQTIGTTTLNGASTSFTLSTEGTTVVSFFARDNWGNVETTKTKTVRIDKTDPVVSCGTADGIWHATDVSIACTAGDALSGLANPSDASFLLTTNVPAETETNNAFTDTRTVFDVAGNSTVAGPIGGNMVDKKAPTISISTPTGGAVYLLNQTVLADYACSDGGSGLATCVGNVADGLAIDTATVGNKTFTVNTTDNVGNSRTLSVDYIVTYNICLSYDPTDPFSGNSVPIRLQLCDANEVNVSSAGVIPHATLIQPGAITPTSHANPTSDFLYNSGMGGYIYVLNVKTLAAPGSYTLEFTVPDDPITHSAPFMLR